MTYTAGFSELAGEPTAPFEVRDLPADFDAAFLDPYYRSVGLEGPPAQVFARLRTAGWPAYATRAEAQVAARAVGDSPLFDAGSYRTRAGAHALASLDPLLHYVIVGEAMGFAPSSAFDPEYYGDRYPDVAAAGVNRLAHYLSYGRAERRRPLSVTDTLTFDRHRLDASRQTILLIAHEASRTGAPIIGYHIARRLSARYNVVAVLLGDGDLFPEFDRFCAATIGPVPRAEWHALEAGRLVRRLCDSYRVLYAIANSIETRLLIPALAHAHVPLVTLVHEFAFYTRPASSMGYALDLSTHVVFPTDLVAHAALKEHGTLETRTMHVLPQGPCPAPVSRGSRESARALSALAEIRRQKQRDNALVVFGCGQVHIRKGVDLFLSCAAAVARVATARPVRFLWLGGGYRPEDDSDYSCFLADQIERSGLSDMVSIVDAVLDVEPAYALAEVFLLSSRLDPMPNVAIDAALRGIPVVCFEGTTGIAGLLAADPVARQSVVPYLDVTRAANVIVHLAADDGERTAIGDATRRLAREALDTDRYVARLDELGLDAVRIERQQDADAATLSADPLFDASVFVHPRQPPLTRDQAISEFVRRWCAVALAERPVSNGLFRRPCAGFHPQIYAHGHRDRYDVSAVNPLAHFVRTGRPDGPWWHEVITPDANADPRPQPGLGKVALHGHFYYAELASELLRKLDVNAWQCDLLFTTDDERKAKAIREAARRYDRGAVEVEIVPNRGRDIGPLLTVLADRLRDYAVVGHVHGKRSPDIESAEFGEVWREFLWQHLIGDCHPMMDLILSRFVADDHLGLVFPDDPHLCDWDDNRALASDLAARMGMAVPLPPFFDFPIGTMFWARPAALGPLLQLGLSWIDYPAEPVPIDGTILHAIERLLPFAARHAGYRYATTHVPGVVR